MDVPPGFSVQSVRHLSGVVANVSLLVASCPLGPVSPESFKKDMTVRRVTSSAFVNVFSVLVSAATKGEQVLLCVKHPAASSSPISAVNSLFHDLTSSSSVVTSSYVDVLLFFSAFLFFSQCYLPFGDFAIPLVAQIGLVFGVACHHQGLLREKWTTLIKKKARVFSPKTSSFPLASSVPSQKVRLILQWLGQRFSDEVRPQLLTFHSPASLLFFEPKAEGASPPSIVTPGRECSSAGGYRVAPPWQILSRFSAWAVFCAYAWIHPAGG